MKYTYYQGLIKERISKLALLTITLLFALTAAMGAIQSSMAAAQSELLDPFTKYELDNNWIADRQFPSGGVESVAFDGRNNVAKIGVNPEGQNPSQFYQFEGIKKVEDFGTDVQVDLYVPTEWQEAAVVNVGFWTSDSPITAYPAIYYRNGANVEAGFYTWDVVRNEANTAWVGVYNPSDVPVNYNGWNTLKISLDTNNDLANYFINGEASGEMYAGSDTIGQVFLNHYNDGERDYTAHWHVGVEKVPAKAAPAVAAELLDEAGIKARYGQGRNGGNHIADVAREMDRGAYFNEVAKEDVFAYECEIVKFLNTKLYPASVLASSECYLEVETLEVDSALINGADSPVLGDGVEYAFVASDTWTNSNGAFVVDAAYNNSPNFGYEAGGEWVKQIWRNLELQVNGQETDWGPFNKDHVYKYFFTGEGDTVNFRIFDGQNETPIAGWYNDNDGSLTVDIFQKLY